MDAPEKMNETLALWEEFKKDRFDIYLSQITIEEINECNEEKSRDDANHKTFNGVRTITSLKNCKSVDLVAPTYFLGKE